MPVDPVTQEIRQAHMDNMLLHSIKKIADSEYQHKAWIECSIPNVVDDWEEAMCTFFDDANIDGFLKDMTPESDPEFGLSAHQIEELWKLRNIFDSYDPKIPKYDYVDPKKVLVDPEWHKVVECAQETLKAFDGYKVPTDDFDVQ